MLGDCRIRWDIVIFPLRSVCICALIFLMKASIFPHRQKQYKNNYKHIALLPIMWYTDHSKYDF